MATEEYYQQEESLGKVYDSRIIRRLFVYARPYIWKLAAALVLAAFLSGSQVILPYLTKTGIDRFILVKAKRIDLSGLSETQRDEIYSRYEGRSVRLPHDQFVIVEGLPDPKDQKELTASGALDPEPYYLLNLDRYPGSDQTTFRELMDSGKWTVIPTLNSNQYVMKMSELDKLELKIRNQIRAPDHQGVGRICLVYLAILLASLVVMFGEVYLMAWIGQKIMVDIRMALFDHVQRLPIQFFNTQPTGRLVTRVTNDVNVLNEVFTSILVDIFKNVLMLAGIITAMLMLAPRLAIVTFCILPFTILAAWFFKHKMRGAYRKVRAKIALINATLSEHISGIKVIQLFASERLMFRKFQTINHEAFQANMYELTVNSMFSPVIVFLENVGIALILYYGGGQVVQNSITLGTLVAFLSYLSMFFGPVRDIAEKFNIMQSAMASSERIFMLMDHEPEDIDETEDQTPEQPRIQGAIEFKNVWFAYDGEDWILKDVSFSIQPGEVVAFVGATGSGKTTIINLLSKFFNINKGQILIDGVDIKHHSRNHLRGNMAMVLQDVFLFAGDIRKNIRLNKHDITDSDIERVAQYVHADRFIERLPGTYAFELQEGGTTLSQGQRQLLAFARALAFDPSILILDEATANIDSETEKWIQDALEKLWINRTAVVVAHRLSTIKKANKIIVMHRGRIREIGDHQSLLAARGIYYRLYQLQYKDQEAVSHGNFSPGFSDQLHGNYLQLPEDG